MTRIPHAAFGFVIFRNIFSAHEEYEVDTTQQPLATIFYTAGRFSFFTQDGAPVFSAEPGMLVTPDNSPIGVFRGVLPATDGECLCLDPKANRGYLPAVQVFSLKAGETADLPKGTKLFLGAGSLSLANKTVNKPSQILISSSKILASANSDCYGLLFV